MICVPKKYQPEPPDGNDSEGSFDKINFCVHDPMNSDNSHSDYDAEETVTETDDGYMSPHQRSINESDLHLIEEIYSEGSGSEPDLGDRKAPPNEASRTV